jgi:hypothetical protein
MPSKRSVNLKSKPTWTFLGMRTTISVVSWSWMYGVASLRTFFTSNRRTVCTTTITLTIRTSFRASRLFEWLCNDSIPNGNPPGSRVSYKSTSLSVWSLATSRLSRSLPLRKGRIIFHASTLFPSHYSHSRGRVSSYYQDRYSLPLLGGVC